MAKLKGKVQIWALVYLGQTLNSPWPHITKVLSYMKGSQVRQIPRIPE